MSSSMVTSPRQRTDMATIFDVFCEVGSPDDVSAPLILTKYPEDYNDDSVLKSVRQFSFPCKMKELDSEAVQLFSFVLTDAQSKYTFGYCRYTPRNNTCICFLSGFSWPAVFYKMLNHISLIMNNGSQSDLDAILTRIYHTDIPNTADHLTFESGAGSPKLEIDIPDLNKLPTLREDKFMLEFFNAVSQKQMMAIYASLLKERRIIFTGRKISQLSSCIYAASTLLYPMFWQSVFIPVLPEQLVDMVMAPMPFLIGVHKKVLQNSGMKELGDVVIIDLEEKTLQSAHDDMVDLPSEVISHLKSALKNSSDMGDSMARCFLRANVLLFGGYRLGFVRNELNGEITWDKELFIREQRPSCQNYLASLIGADGVQYLERFMDEKLRSLNTGVPISDEFEREINAMEGKIKTQVKENASDVIGALKDKVTGIQIGAKFNKLTSSKDLSRGKNWSLKKAAKNGAIEPLSFENMQWQDQAADSGSSRDPSPRSDSGKVPETNLIDFDSPIKSNLDTALSEFNPFAATTTGQSTFYTSHPLDLPAVQPVRPPSGMPIASSSNPFVDPFVTPDTPQTNKQSSSSMWEKFE